MQSVEVNNVLATTFGSEPDAKKRLIDIFSPAEVHFAKPNARDEIRRLIPQCEVAILRRIPRWSSKDSPLLKWVHIDMSGLDAIARPDICEGEIAFTSSSGRSAPVLAEHAIFFMLSLVYRSRTLEAAQRRGVWGIEGYHRLLGLAKRKVLIVGWGHTGRALLPRCQALDAKVSVFTRSEPEARPDDVEFRSQAAGDRIEEALDGIDILVLAASLNDSSHRMINAEGIARMNRGAFIVNVARAELVCPESLLAGLRTGTLGGVGLDVAYREPMMPWDPLWRQPNTIITPHVTPKLPDRAQRSLDIIEQNYARLKAAKPMLNCLGPDDVYTKKKIHTPSTQLQRQMLKWSTQVQSVWSRLARPRLHS
ncbi:MAG: NAD(P)-dependent oxidoreductase [Pseudomonadota bacterium]